MKMIRTKHVVALLCCIFFLHDVHGQVINTEQKRSFQNKEGWIGAADLGLTYIRNTKRILQASSRITAQFNKKRHMVLLINDLNLMKVDQAALQNSGFQHVRYNFRVKKYLIPEAFVQAQYNQIWKLDMRFLIGTGPRFQIMKNDSNRIFVGTMVMYEFEKVSGGQQYNRDFRSSSYLSMAFGVGKKLTFESITYYQPLFRDFRDFRVSSESSLTAMITKHLGFKSSFGFNFDSRPPDGLTQIFMANTNGFSYKF